MWIRGCLDNHFWTAGCLCVAELSAIWCRNFSHSTCVCRFWHWPMMDPSRTLRAANKGVGAVGLVVMRHGLCTSLLDRQARLRAVQGLDLALLVAAQHQGVLRGRHVEADDVLQFLDEMRIPRHLEAAHDVRLESVGAPMARNRGGVNLKTTGHGARAPVRGRFRRRLLRQIHQIGDVDLLGRGTARKVALDPGQALLDEAVAPARLGSVQRRLPARSPGSACPAPQTKRSEHAAQFVRCSAWSAPAPRAARVPRHSVPTSEPLAPAISKAHRNSPLEITSRYTYSQERETILAADRSTWGPLGSYRAETSKAPRRAGRSRRRRTSSAAPWHRRNRPCAPAVPAPSSGAPANAGRGATGR